MKAKTINNLLTVVIYGALVLNAYGSAADMWAFTGSAFGWALLVSGIWLVVNDKLNERAKQ